MNAVTIVVAVVVVAVAIIAVFGSYRTLRSESCCSEDKACSCGETKHCTIRKSDDS